MKLSRFVLVLLLTCPVVPAVVAQVAALKSGENDRSDYRITARDTIEFQVYNQADMTSVQRVTSTGEVRLPLIGTVKIAGSTLRQAELLLEALYRSDGYFVEPQ